MPVKTLLVAVSKTYSTQHRKCYCRCWWRLFCLQIPVPFVCLMYWMIWCSVSSSYCHLLTFPLLSSKTFGLVWGIDGYYSIVQASSSDEFEYSFSFCLFTAQISDGKEDPPLVPQGVCVIHAGGFFKHLQWWAGDLRLLEAQRYVAGCFSLLSSSSLQRCVSSPNAMQGSPLLFVVVLPLIYTDGQLLAVGRLLRYVLGRQQVD